MFTGCITSGDSGSIVKPPVSVCSLPTGYDLEQAFSQAQATLSDPACRHKFDLIFDVLIEIAKGDPKPENRVSFNDFLVWCKGNNVISQVMAEEKFKRFFSRKFYTLPDTYKTASYCGQMDRLIDDMREELKQKNIGFVQVCKTIDDYSKVSDDFKAMEVILKATCAAIEDRK